MEVGSGLGRLSLPVLIELVGDDLGKSVILVRHTDNGTGGSPRRDMASDSTSDGLRFKMDSMKRR